ncbi:hypothetical protein M407DRAFT_201430 [Tulasnella calospora MUT 4182]|uniref:Uncharacterized protein n=1 Tax=Tulasnella calospora MUT 4182 TaxID=1051891 RepID=A0A0C3QI27_9AGAM|nr:hypothetical protein M407DRAFT_201430 [Tulasnella calospora MUT 4182]
MGIFVSVFARHPATASDRENRRFFAGKNPCGNGDTTYIVVVVALCSRRRGGENWGAFSPPSSDGVFVSGFRRHSEFARSKTPCQCIGRSPSDNKAPIS